jgi:hypothetical protein
MAFAGCSAVGDYARDRALDFTDLVDFKAGLSLGIAAKIEVTDYVASGLGFGISDGYQFYGRILDPAGGFYAHLLLVGADGGGPEGKGPGAFSDKICTLLYQQHFAGMRPPFVSRFRVGGEILVPVIHLGIYLNCGEIVDFLGGLATLDPAGDDGLPKGISWQEFQETKAVAALESDDVDKRIDAVRRLKRLTHERFAVDLLIVALDDTDPSVRAEAAGALGEMAWAWRAVEPLIDALSDEDQRVRENAARSLERVTGESFGSDPARWKEWWEFRRNIR